MKEYYLNQSVFPKEIETKERLSMRLIVKAG